MIATLIAGMVGFILGAWINNIFFWKVKQKIEYLDILVKNAIDYNSKFLAFICLKCPVEDEETNPTEHRYIEFGDYSNIVVNNGYCSNYIIFGSPVKCRDTDLYKAVSIYYNFIANVMKNRNAQLLRDNFFLLEGAKPTEMALEYNKYKNNYVSMYSII